MIKKIFFSIRAKKPDFKIDHNYKTAMSLEEAKFYKDLAEKQLENSIDTGKIITDRATNLLTLTSGVLIGLVTFCIDKWEKNHHMDFLMTFSLWGCACLFIASAILVFAVTPKQYCIPGVDPSKVFTEVLFKDKRDNDARQKIMAISLIENYKNNTDENIERNKERWLSFKIAIFIIVLAPLLFATCHLFSR